MADLAKLISALAALAWPIVFAVLLYKLYGPIRVLVDSARERKFTIKVAGNELTMEEVSEQQRAILTDLQAKVAEIEKQAPGATARTSTESQLSRKRILWVDDEPKNNSYLVAGLTERGAMVDTALSTDEAVAKIKTVNYDIVISDMGRPEGDQAGLDLTRQLKELSVQAPIYIFCGGWAAKNLRKQALDAGVSGITSSGTTLLSMLPL
ncbi:response regulator [Achromobacter marplatensis]